MLIDSFSALPFSGQTILVVLFRVFQKLRLLPICSPASAYGSLGSRKTSTCTADGRFTAQPKMPAASLPYLKCRDGAVVHIWRRETKTVPFQESQSVVAQPEAGPEIIKRPRQFRVEHESALASNSEKTDSCLLHNWLCGLLDHVVYFLHDGFVEILHSDLRNRGISQKP